MDISVVQVRLKGESLKIVKAKKIFGITVDDKLIFKQHVKEKNTVSFQCIMGYWKFCTRT